MPLRLNLIRHAKSAWDDASLSDHERVLNRRGMNSAKAIGQWMEESGHSLGHVECSDASRTRETYALISGAFDGDIPVSFRPNLYLCSAMEICNVIRKATVPVLTVIGHNPGIGGFACGIVAERPDHPDFTRYPTCATTILDFDITSWADLAPQSGRVIDFKTPRELL